MEREKNERINVSLLDEHICYCEKYSENNSKYKRSHIDFIFVRMIFFVTELYTRNDISKHRPTKNQISWHQHLLDQKLVFWTKNNSSSQEKKSYDYGKKKENSLDDFEKCIHTKW